jgi:hypothetical protein
VIILNPKSQRYPFAGSDIGSGLITSVWIFLAQTLEPPIRIGEILDGPTRARRMRLKPETIQRP